MDCSSRLNLRKAFLLNSITWCDLELAANSAAFELAAISAALEQAP